MSMTSILIHCITKARNGILIVFAGDMLERIGQTLSWSSIPFMPRRTLCHQCCLCDEILKDIVGQAVHIKTVPRCLYLFVHVHRHTRVNKNLRSVNHLLLLLRGCGYGARKMGQIASSCASVLLHKDNRKHDASWRSMLT